MKLLYKIFCFFYPERCPYCERLIKSGAIACKRCQEKINALQKPIIRGAHGYRCVSSFFYGGSVRRMILRVKYHERIQFLSQVAVILEKDIRAVYPDADFDIITFVPMHKTDLGERGYNQSEILAKHLAKRMQIPCAETLLKIKHTKKQQKCTYHERKNNLRGAFKPADKSMIEGRNILIIDDIITTGSTLYECCKTLNKAKPRLVCCATIANASEPVDKSAII